MTRPELVPGLAGIPAACSGSSFVDGQRGRLTYRGYAIEDLAEKSDFEEVTWLLLFGELPSASDLAQFRKTLAEARPIPERMLDVLRSLPQRDLITAQTADTVSDAVMSMKEHGVSQLPILEDGRVVGIITESDVLGKLVEGQTALSSSVAEVMMRNVQTVNVSEDAGGLTSLFATGHVGLIVDDDMKLVGLVTKMDLVDHLTRTPDEQL